MDEPIIFEMDTTLMVFTKPRPSHPRQPGLGAQNWIFYGPRGINYNWYPKAHYLRYRETKMGISHNISLDFGLSQDSLLLLAVENYVGENFGHMTRSNTSATE